LKVTTEKRNSLTALQDRENIILTIQNDPTMQQRWERYSKENYYAQGIEFDDVIGILTHIVK
jgi:hypothetical protein